MIYSFIMCAGKQSRFHAALPKALMPLKNHVTILDANIKNSLQFCDKVVVVASYENYQYFEKYKNNNVDVIQIESGFGCGDAVYKALYYYPTLDEDTCFIMWGDSIQIDKQVFLKCLLKYHNDVIIPVRWEENPYVQIKHFKGKATRVLFSKYGDKITSGMHDLSIFFGNCKKLKKYLSKFRKKILVNGKYKHKHNDEMLFLDIINEVEGQYKILEINNHKDLSFNTLEQYNNLVKSI